jgi:hypothetical protein
VFLSAMVDFRAHLRQQLQFIERSCQDYDQGHAGEAVRIALSLRIIFYDTKRCTSILKHLGNKQIILLSTAEVFKKPQVHNLALVIPQLGIPHFKAEMIAPLDRAARKQSVNFETWWRKELIIELNSGKDVMTRRDLILGAAHRDGGAHVDDKLDPTYDLARLGAGMTVEFVLKGARPSVEIPFENVHYASLRQIGYEALNSPDLLSASK